MNRERIISLIVAVLVIISSFGINKFTESKKVERTQIKVGFMYDGDESTPYTYNFIRAERAMKETYGDRVEVIERNNVPEDNADKALQELVDEGCNIIFSNSFGYGEYVKMIAEKHPEIEFCQATQSNGNVYPVLSNYHTFMGEIYEGRFTAGVVAGLKLKELIDNGTIDEKRAWVGYVAAYPYAEVISGYTAFFLGIRSVCPQAVMRVMYTNSWSDYSLEKEYAEKLIHKGCVIISQHSDTIGPAVACEKANADHPVFHVGYNQSMLDVAPTTSLCSTRINWAPYMVAAVGAVLDGVSIESRVDGNVHGQDVGAGFEKNWVQMLELNTIICADMTEETVDAVVDALINKQLEVFKGDYTGTDPFDENDTIDLREGYIENENSSAPTFHWVLDDVIIIDN